MKKWMWVFIGLVAAGMGLAGPSLAETAPEMVVGRVYYIEGDLLRYIPEEKDWVAVVNDAPFGTEDTLYSSANARAELLVPNGTWIRTGSNTQIQFIALDRDLTQADVAIGMGRFHNKSADAVVKVTSPFGDVLAYSNTVFDFYVGENSAEVVAVKGTVSFVHPETGARYDARAGGPSILADQRQVSSGNGTVDPDWDQWNAGRESFWAGKARSRGRSAQYLPPDLGYESYALEENGRWEDVYYEGRNCRFWRPVTVAPGWSPFTVGRWTDWYGDQTWIPAEPFGYVTHHYGNWVYARNHWFWAPPVVSVRVGLPLLDVGYFWYPGRVSWIHTGVYLGWVPLAPREKYYSRRHWGGPHTVVVNNININRININVRNHAHINHAVVINRDDLYRVNNYRKHGFERVNHTSIIKSYHGAPIVNNKVINNYANIKQRYAYSNHSVKDKPHDVRINRIQNNQTVIHEGRNEKASRVREHADRIPEGRINREARIETPRRRDHGAPATDANRRKSGNERREPEIKTYRNSREQDRSGSESRRMEPSRERSREAVQQPDRPERVRPERPDQPEQPRTERVTPSRQRRSREEIQQPEQPEQVRRERPDQPEQPRTERVTPSRQRRSREEIQQPEQPGQVRRERPDQPEQPRTERVTPSRQRRSREEIQQPEQPGQVRRERPDRSGQSPGESVFPSRQRRSREDVGQPERSVQPDTSSQRTKRRAPVEPDEAAKPDQPGEPQEIPADNSHGEPGMQENPEQQTRP